MKRTTILADEALLVEAKYLAAQEGKTLTAVVHEALAEYVAAHRRPRSLSILGIGRSGESDISERADEILAAEIDPAGGWSPRRKLEASREARESQ